MKQKTSITAFAVIVGVGVVMTPDDAHASRCEIAVTTTLKHYIQVTMPNSIFDHEVVFEGAEKPRQAPLIAYGECPGDRELLFSVHDCSEKLVYEFMIRPKGVFEEDESIPLYIIGGPFDDEFDGEKVALLC